MDLSLDTHTVHLWNESYGKIFQSVLISLINNPPDSLLCGFVYKFYNPFVNIMHYNLAKNPDKKNAKSALDTLLPFVSIIVERIEKKPDFISVTTKMLDCLKNLRDKFDQNHFFKEIQPYFLNITGPTICVSSKDGIEWAKIKKNFEDVRTTFKHNCTDAYITLVFHVFNPLVNEAQMLSQPDQQLQVFIADFKTFVEDNVLTLKSDIVSSNTVQFIQTSCMEMQQTLQKLENREFSTCCVRPHFFEFEPPMFVGRTHQRKTQPDSKLPSKERQRQQNDEKKLMKEGQRLRVERLKRKERENEIREEIRKNNEEAREQTLHRLILRHEETKRRRRLSSHVLNLLLL